MKIAITYENNQVFQHFGKCPSFLLVDIEDGKIQNKTMLQANGSGHGALGGLLAQAHVDTLVCGGIGQGARDILAQANIALISGASGNVDAVLEQVISGTLVDNPAGKCDHHHEDGHDCVGHSCK
ncbi:MAG: NifB/NifX family molybdenum-iron cluster-binding protein [Longicatena sp.]